jgi:hypothetical protein
MFPTPYYDSRNGGKRLLAVFCSWNTDVDVGWLTVTIVDRCVGVFTLINTADYRKYFTLAAQYNVQRHIDIHTMNDASYVRTYKQCLAAGAAAMTVISHEPNVLHIRLRQLLELY